jgi:hypothetical protein
MKTPLPLMALALAGSFLIPMGGQAQQVPDWLLKLKLPNSGAKASMTPTAWGAAFGSAYLGTGAARRSPYLPSADGIVELGYGMGDPVLNVGIQIGTTASDLSEFNNVSFSFKLHRYLARGTTIALGGESLFSNDAISDDAGDTFYLVVSHVVQTLGSSRPGIGRVHVSVGVGTGRFAQKSDRDFSEGKGRNGTIVFGNLAVEVARDLNAILEWSGTNLLTGLSRTVQTGSMPIMISIGLADLTGYSGNGVRLVAAAAVAISL